MRREENYTCECGNPKRKTRNACDRCTYLDGRGGAEWEVISLLRESSEGSAADALAFELGVQVQSVYGTLHNLIRKGRLVRFSHVAGGGGRGRPAYMYRLVDDGRAS